MDWLLSPLGIGTLVFLFVASLVYWRKPIMAWLRGEESGEADPRSDRS